MAKFFHIKNKLVDFITEFSIKALSFYTYFIYAILIAFPTNILGQIGFK